VVVVAVAALRGAGHCWFLCACPSYIAPVGCILLTVGYCRICWCGYPHHHHLTRVHTVLARRSGWDRACVRHRADTLPALSCSLRVVLPWCGSAWRYCLPVVLVRLFIRGPTATPFLSCYIAIPHCGSAFVLHTIMYGDIHTHTHALLVHFYCILLLYTDSLVTFGMVFDCITGALWWSFTLVFDNCSCCVRHCLLPHVYPHRACYLHCPCYSLFDVDYSVITCDYATHFFIVITLLVSVIVIPLLHLTLWWCSLLWWGVIFGIRWFRWCCCWCV